MCSRLCSAANTLQVNEMGQMALQYGMTGYIKRLVAGDSTIPMTFPEELASAVAGGAFVAPFASAVECVMIQQQHHVRPPPTVDNAPTTIYFQ
jgi:hypothetical protein